MMVTKTHTEQKLLRQLANGREDVFAYYFREYHTSVYQYILKYVHSPELADDLCQETFIRIWEQREKLAYVSSFRAYLFISARNHTLNTLSKASRKEAALGEILHHYPVMQNSIEDNVLYKEYQIFLEQILDSLPPRTREVFRLCREQGKSYEEAAIELDISKNAIKNHMVAAMKTLGDATDRDLGISLTVLLVFLGR